MSKEHIEHNLRVTADMIINYKDEGIVFIKRKYEPFKNQWALPGGHLDSGKENTLTAAIREALEETNLVISAETVRLLGVYSDPERDPRGHYITVAYFCQVSEGELKALDDAKEIQVFPLEQLPEEMAFDHGRIMTDFKQRVLKESFFDQMGG